MRNFINQQPVISDKELEEALDYIRQCSGYYIYDTVHYKNEKIMKSFNTIKTKISKLEQASTELECFKPLIERALRGGWTERELGILNPPTAEEVLEIGNDYVSKVLDTTPSLNIEDYSIRINYRGNVYLGYFETEEDKEYQIRVSQENADKLINYFCKLNQQPSISNKEVLDE